MSKHNYNRGSRRNGGNQSRRQRRLNPQSAAGKNVRRRSILRKVLLENRTIKKSLGTIIDKLKAINKLLGISEQREKRMEEEEKRIDLSRVLKAGWEGAKHYGGLALKGAIVGSAVSSLLLPKPETYTEDEAPEDTGRKTDPNSKGVRDFDGAKIVIGKDTDLSGINPDFWKRFTAAVREYQTKHNGGIVRINEGFRTRQRQEQLVAQDIAAHGKRTVTAAPGRSMHEYGFALDMNSYEANEMDRLGLLKKYGLGRPDRRFNENTGKWEEAHHIEDMTLSADLKARVRDAGTESDLAQSLHFAHVGNLRNEEPAYQGKPVPVTDELLQQGLELMEQYKQAMFANGGVVNVVAGEAGKEAVIPMNQRGAEYLAEAVKDAFKSVRESRSRKLKGGSKFEAYLKETFIPELKRKAGKQ